MKSRTAEQCGTVTTDKVKEMAYTKEQDTAYRRKRYREDEEFRKKICERNRKWRERNPGYLTKYYHEHQQELNEYKRNYNHINTD